MNIPADARAPEDPAEPPEDPHAFFVCQGPCQGHYPQYETVVVTVGGQRRRSCFDCLPDVCKAQAATLDLGLGEVA